MWDRRGEGPRANNWQRSPPGKLLEPFSMILVQTGICFGMVCFWKHKMVSDNPGGVDKSGSTVQGGGVTIPRGGQLPRWNTATRNSKNDNELSDL